MPSTNMENRYILPKIPVGIMVMEDILVATMAEGFQVMNNSPIDVVSVPMAAKAHETEIGEVDVSEAKSQNYRNVSLESDSA